MKTLNGYEVVDAKAREDIKGIQAAVEAIPEYDLTPYATKSELPTKVSQLQNDSRFITLEEVPETDLSEYAKKSELPTVPKKVSELTNDAGYITAAEVPKTDLSAYAKKSDIPDVSGFITSIPSEYVTESELNAKGYLTQHQDISHLAPKTSIPTKVSQLANDSNYLTSIPSNYITEAELEAKNYLTEHQSLAAYATKTYVDNTVAENQPNLSGYAKKTDIPDVSGFISEIPSEYVTDSELAAKGYLVEADLSAYAKKSEIPEGVDLSEYAKKSEIPTVPTKTSQLTNDSNFLTAIPSEYITETELDNKGYLTQHQSLSEYAKKSEIPDVSHFITSIPEEYVTETELNNKGYLTQHQSLEGYATKTYVDDAIAGIDIPGGGNSSIVYLDIRNIGTAYEPAPQEAITLAKDLLAGKSLIVYLRTSDTEYRQADIKCGTSSVELFAAPKINAHNGDATQGICVIQDFGSNGVEDWHAYKATDTRPALVTQSELDNAIAGIDIPKAESTTFFLDFSTATSMDQAATEAMVAFANYFKNNDNVSVYMRDSFDSDYYYPALIQKIGTYTFNFLKAGVNLNDVESNGALNWDTIRLYSNDNGATWKYTKLTSRSTTIATKEYVDNAIAGIDIPGGTSKEVVEIPYSNTFPTAMQDKLKEIWLYGIAGNNILDKYDIYIIDAADKDNCRANSVYCSGSETGSNDYKRFTVSAQRSESSLLSCTINPYTSQINRNISERIVTESYLESNFHTWQSDTNVNTEYCRWNWTNTDVRMVKLIGQVSGETDHYATFEIAAPNGSSFNTNTYHQVPNLLGVKSSGDYKTYNFLRVCYTGSYFELQDPEGTNCSNYITPTAMYYLT